MNISVLNFDTSKRSTIRFRDVTTNNVAALTSQERFEHIMTSSGSEVEVFDWSSGNEINMLYDIQGKFNSSFSLFKSICLKCEMSPF